MLPLTASPNFVTLAQLYRDYDIAFPKLKGVTLAQWALESGWGSTRLAKQFHNYGGMKWGSVDHMFGEPAMYGGQKYTGFSSPTMFIEGYWNRIMISPAWATWQDHMDSPEDFITFITPEWLNGRKADGSLAASERKYIHDVLDIRNHRTEEFFAHAT
jgi:N-acetylmuramoyl-L-alanine amidase